MELEVLDQSLSVCQLKSLKGIEWQGAPVFLCKTNDEISLVCETDKVPDTFQKREDGWRAIRVVGPLDFSLVGLLAQLTDALAKRNIPVFAVSTFDTDYVLINRHRLNDAVDALREKGYRFV